MGYAIKLKKADVANALKHTAYYLGCGFVALLVMYPFIVFFTGLD